MIQKSKTVVLLLFILLSACSSQHQVFKSNSVYSKRTFSKNIRHKSFQHTDIAEKNSTDLEKVNAAISGPIQKGEALINPIELKPETTIPMENISPNCFTTFYNPPSKTKPGRKIFKQKLKLKKLNLKKTRKMLVFKRA
jgi:hypothetical protein